MPKQKPLRVRHFFQGKEVDKIPEWAVQKMSENASKALSDLCAVHPEWLEQLKRFSERQENEENSRR